MPYCSVLSQACSTSYLISAFSIVANLTDSAELTTIIGVMAVNVVVQFLDNNVLVPMVVISKVKINAFMSVIVILIGSKIWGIAGMFLTISMTVIVKIIFDQVEYLEPWGFLIGDHVPKILSRETETLAISDSAKTLESDIANSKFFSKVG